MDKKELSNSEKSNILAEVEEIRLAMETLAKECPGLRETIEKSLKMADDIQNTLLEGTLKH